MKRILLMAAVICMGHVATAQKPDTMPATIEKPKVDKGAYITMQAGQAMLVKDNKAEKLASELTLNDGTIVNSDGTIKKQDGTSIKMKEGDRIYLDGGMSMNKKGPALIKEKE